MSVLFNDLGFEVFKNQNARKEDMDLTYQKIVDKINQSKEEVLVYLYYSGHGVMVTLTKMVCNEEQSFHRYWDLESKLSDLSKMPNTFVIGVFDCCREPLLGSEIIQNEILAESKDDFEQNLYITFGC